MAAVRKGDSSANFAFARDPANMIRVDINERFSIALLQRNKHAEAFQKELSNREGMLEVYVEIGDLDLAKGRSCGQEGRAGKKR